MILLVILIVFFVFEGKQELIEDEVSKINNMITYKAYNDFLTQNLRENQSNYFLLDRDFNDNGFVKLAKPFQKIGQDLGANFSCYVVLPLTPVFLNEDIGHNSVWYVQSGEAKGEVIIFANLTLNDPLAQKRYDQIVRSIREERKESEKQNELEDY